MNQEGYNKLQLGNVEVKEEDKESSSSRQESAMLLAAKEDAFDRKYEVISRAINSRMSRQNSGSDSISINEL